ncbi:hypothetical protein IMZ11_11720 [Microtetraspora sp. AC03309]|uniref:GNAT family N-acetyltransferase n=1 Tax=Microtetraspora sp. AC03309 TaxID=2779376 RepID=UPI001E40A411|nr:hypothetical protein [Microtetraspora sp. AC03309]MCC5576300.1 hypothetical protein [Microtetraspora sp. AC03309]
MTYDADRCDGVHSATLAAGLEIRPIRSADAEEVLAVYQAGLDTGQSSFETTAPSWETFDASKLAHPRYVAAETETGRITGWVAASLMA